MRGRRRATAAPREGSARPRDRLLVAAAIAYVLLSNLTPISESDFWIQLKVGDEIRRTGAIPATIEYTFTEARDLPFIAHEWVPSTVTSALFSVVGYPGMIVFKCLLALVVTGLAAALAYRIQRDLVVSVLIACAVATAMNFRFQMRPEIFAFAIALGSLYLLTSFAITGRVAWLVGLIPLSVLWANSHGSLVLGLAFPWMFLLGELADDLRSHRTPRARVHAALATVGVVMAVVSLANPYGMTLLTHAATIGQADWLKDNIVEFGPTFDARTRVAAYFWVYVAFAGAVLAAAAWGRRRLNGTSIVLLVAFSWMSLQSIRYTAWFALACTYVLAHALPGLASPPARRRVVARAATAALAVGIGVTILNGDVRGHRIGFRNEAPMSPEALRFVRESGISGNVFNTFSHGDQLIHGFYPALRVAIDSRTDAYGEAYYMTYRSLSGRSFKALGPPGDLVAFLTRYGVHTIVTRPFELENWNDKGHGGALEQLGFAIVYADPTTVILRRAPSAIGG